MLGLIHPSPVSSLSEPLDTFRCILCTAPARAEACRAGRLGTQWSWSILALFQLIFRLSLFNTFPWNRIWGLVMGNSWFVRGLRVYLYGKQGMVYYKHTYFNSVLCYKAKKEGKTLPIVFLQLNLILVLRERFPWWKQKKSNLKTAFFCVFAAIVFNGHCSACLTVIIHTF